MTALEASLQLGLVGIVFDRDQIIRVFRFALVRKRALDDRVRWREQVLSCVDNGDGRARCIVRIRLFVVSSHAALNVDRVKMVSRACERNEKTLNAN